MIPGTYYYTEPSIAYSPSTGRVIVAYNDGRTTPVLAPTPMGWSFGTNLGAMTVCNAGTVGCGTGGGTVPMAPYDAVMGGAQTRWRTDPNVVAVSSSMVAYVTMADAAGQQNNAVVVSISMDGGATFGNTQFVNNGSGVCNGGLIDQPSAASDGNGNIWVAWRFRSGLSAYTICVRGGRVGDKTGGIAWFNNGSTVSNPVHDFRWGVGGVEIATDPTDGEIGVAYTFTDEYAQGPCPNQWVNMKYLFQRATSNGTTWDPAETVLNTSVWPTCIDSIHVENTSNRGTFGFVFDPVSRKYVFALQRSMAAIDVYARSHGVSQASTLQYTYFTPTGLELLHPVLATDNGGHFGLGFYQTDGLGNVTFDTLGALSLTTWQGPAIDSYPFAPNPTDPNRDYERNLADYQGLTMQPGLATSARIFAAWTDMSQYPAPQNQVWVNSLNVN